MDDPSILDYLKSLLRPGKQKIYLFPEEVRRNPTRKTSRRAGKVNNQVDRIIPWKTGCAVLLALLAQSRLEPADRNIGLAIILYALAFILFWLDIKNIRSMIKDEPQKSISNHIRLLSFIISLVFLLGAFWTFNNNTFTLLNVSLWGMAIGLFIFSVWQRQPKEKKVVLQFQPWFFVFFILVVLIVLFFRIYQLNQVPAEMFSDHAEKLLDIIDILNGKTSIYFIRNTGREAFQFYLTVLIIKFFGTGISFLSLKIGTVLAGLVTLPFIYLLAKEIGNRWTGILAFIFAGIAYWPNVISRVGLRYPLYPLFAAPTLYFLVRGLRNYNRNDFVLSGIFLGLGLQGYSPFRIIPIVIVVAFIFFWLHTKQKREFKQLIWLLGLLALTSFYLFLPLFRYALENPLMFDMRALSRLTSIEQQLPGPPMQIFLSNLWNAITMFFYNNGDIWVHSIPLRPALDVVTASFLFLGLIYIIRRYLKNRDWLDIFMLISIPLLMLPSILSLAFPQENPSLNRTGAAIIPVFIIAALGFEVILRKLISQTKKKISHYIIYLLVILLLSWTAINNFNLVFTDYRQEFLSNAWNTSEIGQVIDNFVQSGGNPDHAFVVPYPYWVDTRLVGINAGYPSKDYALWPYQFDSTIIMSDPKIFILKPEDTDSLKELQTIYPQSSKQVFVSETSGKDFIILRIP